MQIERSHFPSKDPLSPSHKGWGATSGQEELRVEWPESMIPWPEPLPQTLSLLQAGAVPLRCH